MRTGRTSRISLALAGATAVAALGAHVPMISVLSPIGPAFAQDTGHGGGHDGGSGGSGGHDDGGHDDGGHGGGHGGHGETDLASGEGVPEPAEPGAGGLQIFNYFRAELGLSAPRASEAYWLPPGYPTDPQVFFAPVLDRAGFGSLAVGHDFGGYRGEVALTAFGASAFSGDWSYTVPPTTGPHASVEGSTSALALMANGYWEPSIPGLGSVQPYLSAGLGLSNNIIGGWSRIKPTDSSVRAFEGDSQIALAWSLGLGLSVPVGEVAGRPAMVDFGYRYFDLGRVTGSDVPVEGSGGGRPVKPLTFDKIEQTLSVSLRVSF